MSYLSFTKEIIYLSYKFLTDSLMCVFTIGVWNQERSFSFIYKGFKDSLNSLKG
jgi:hypothetical protein